jgi:hypothetical protein
MKRSMARFLADTAASAVGFPEAALELEFEYLVEAPGLCILIAQLAAAE